MIVLEYLIEYGWLILPLAAAGALEFYFPDREGVPDDSWVHTDLDSVPYVITRPEPRGHVLPWYRRLFNRSQPEADPPPPMTYRG